MPMDSSTSTLWIDPFPAEGMSDTLLLPIYIEIANSVDSDQTPRSAVSDQGLHCLQKVLITKTCLCNLDPPLNPTFI